MLISLVMFKVRLIRIQFAEGWVVVNKDILMKCKTNNDKYSSPRKVGCTFNFNSLGGWISRQAFPIH